MFRTFNIQGEKVATRYCGRHVAEVADAIASIDEVARGAAVATGADAAALELDGVSNTAFDSDFDASLDASFDADIGSNLDALPFVYLHSLSDGASQVAERCVELGCPPFMLVSIEVASWNDDLTPWECSGVFANDEPFGGKAAAQLRKLEAIVREVESSLAAYPARRCIAGYSLAGLFAAWAPFQTDMFDAVASASGSMWYPGFTEYAEAHDFARAPQAAYFSLGSKEARTPSRLLRSVADGTQAVMHAYQAKGVNAVFESNPGNHFKEPDVRMAKAIRWVLRGEATLAPSNELKGEHA